MKVILGNFQVKTPIGSSVTITKSMSDAVSKCALSVVDNNSSLSVVCPQELLIIDDQVIPNPTVNLLQNPSLDPYTTNWHQGSGVSGITQSTVTGGGIKWTFNNAANGAFQSQYQFLPQAFLVGGQTYMISFYAIGVSPVNFTINGFCKAIDVSNNLLAQFNFSFAVPTTLTRLTFSFTAPAGTSFGDLVFEPTTTSATNSGTLTITQVQYEPEWFTNQSYPSPWCGPSQTNCRQLPSGIWIRQYRKFAGFVVDPIFGEYKGNVRIIQINAVGYAWLMSTIYSNKTYSSQYDSAILTDLLNTYLTSTDPRTAVAYNLVSTTNVVQGVQFSSLVLNWDDLKTVSDSLASQIGFYWTIDDYWNAVYAPPGYFTSSNSLICDGSSTPDMITSFPAYSFQSESDGTQPGSNILVIGSGSNVAQVIDPVQINNIGNICGYFLPTLTSWMRKVNASSLNSVADCNQRGIAELIQYDNPRGLYQLTTDACELIAGQAIAVTSSTDTLNGAPLNQTVILLQDVTATWIGTSDLLQDKWEYHAKLGAVNRQVPHILSRLFRSTNSNTSAPAISQTALVIFERIGVTDGPITTGSPTIGYQATILADTPLAYYRLGELLGTIADDFSGNAQAGTLHGTITLGSAGLLLSDTDKAMTFDGSTGYISLPTSGTWPTGNGAWTLECWCKPTNATNAANGHLVTIGNPGTNSDAASICQTSTGGWGIVTWGGAGHDFQGNGTSAAGMPYHIVATYDGANHLNLYVNGFLTYGPFSPGTLNLSASHQSIGDSWNGTTQALFFTGVIDEAVIYSLALTSTQIQKHYTTGTGGLADYDSGARSSPIAAGWGTATNGNAWTVTNTANAKTSTALLQFYNNAESAARIGASNSLDCTVKARIVINNSAFAPGLLLRYTDINNFIKLDVASGSLRIRKRIAAANSNVATTSVTMNTGTQYWFKLNVSGTTYSAKFWQDGTTEPAAYMISGTASDSILASGLWGLYGSPTTASTIDFDNFTVSV